MTDRMGGYRALKPGKIHLHCPSCGRKMSNMPRDDDPPNAVVLETLCPKCADVAGFSESIEYYDASGNVLGPFAAAPEQEEGK